jgi:hypothetical protein
MVFNATFNNISAISLVVSFIDKEKERQKPVILHERTQKTKYEPHQKQAQLG